MADKTRPAWWAGPHGASGAFDWEWRLGRQAWPTGGGVAEQAESAVAEMSEAATWNDVLKEGGIRVVRANAREPTELRVPPLPRAFRWAPQLGRLVWRILEPVKDATDQLLELVALWYGGRLILASAAATPSANRNALQPGDLIAQRWPQLLSTKTLCAVVARRSAAAPWPSRKNAAAH